MEIDGKSICDIIRVCHKSNVSRLKFGELEVSFGHDQNESRILPYHGEAEQQLGSGAVSMELTTDQKQIMEEADLTDLMVLDPEGWENHNIDRLVHRGTSLDGRI